MPFNAPSTIPNIHYSYPAGYASYGPVQYGYTTPYSALANPPPGTILYDQVYNDDHFTAKCHFRNLLKHNQLSGMPTGFPFRCVSPPRDAHGHSCGRGGTISYASYEFREQFCFADQSARVQQAIFVYSAPEMNSNSGRRMMSWKIYLPARESAPNRDAPKNVTVAHVQVDSMILETSFGIDLTMNPRIVLEALALSIELGVIITIQVANHKTARLYPPRGNVYHEPGEILFLATDSKGRTEVAFVFEM